MDTETSPCAYAGCPNPAEPRRVTWIGGVGEVDISVNLCAAHDDLRDIDDDVIDLLKKEWRKQT